MTLEKMEVIQAKNCGFCPGVRNAISIAEEILSREKPVYCLGPIIHNEDVVAHLAKMGLETVDSVKEIDSGTVLIRSHGVEPWQIEELKKRSLKIVDATCVFVKKLQQITKELENDGYEVVVIGDENHPEVKAVVGCVKEAIVIANESDLHKLPKNKKLGIIGQTTQGLEKFSEIIGCIAKAGFNEFKVINTLCKETIKRQESAVELCEKVDIMFVLGGLASANTRKLAEICKKHNNQTFHLQNFSEFDKSMVLGKATAGVTAGASTPEWIINEFVENLRTLDNTNL
ncbi:MAG: 4-hydroxy-3-methylbut-2-enyl diphosphate reductase [Planctomycetota bacterium]|jgi:4-hydroxy-3-methylbut-2-enyl diphosphate reductase